MTNCNTIQYYYIIKCSCIQYTRFTAVPLKCCRYRKITFSSKYINKSNDYNYYYIHNILSIALYSMNVYMFKKVLRL